MLTNDTTAMNRTITAFFDTHEAAERAVTALTSAGVTKDRITMTAGNGGAAPVAEDKGFWEELKSLFIPDEDRYTYAEGLRRGGYLVTVRTEGADYDRVLDILDDEGSVDMNEREATWRQEGWQGYQAGMFDAGTTATTATTAPVASIQTKASTSAATASTLEAGRDEIVPIVEEQLQVGKRDVAHGKVRLRSYVVETPVNEQVNLRSESVQVERRPVDRALAAGDVAFTDRVIEAEERAEEAVVSKTARVTEEVSLRKVASNETQTISDSVRKTEVQVDDDRQGRAVASAATGTSASRIGEHMDVIASDGQRVGTVDHMEGQDRIKLAKSTSPDGQHHYIPLAWVDHVDQHVHLNKPKLQVQQGW